jgi:hypothetical protein
VSTPTLPGGTIPAIQGPGRGARVKGTWTAIATWVRRESAAAESLVLVFIALGIAFQWWHWSDAQTGAVVGIAAALLGMFVRSQVTPLIQPTTRGRRLVPAPDEAEAAPRSPSLSAPG